LPASATYAKLMTERLEVEVMSVKERNLDRGKCPKDEGFQVKKKAKRRHEKEIAARPRTETTSPL